MTLRLAGTLVARARLLAIVGNRPREAERLLDEAVRLSLGVGGRDAAIVRIDAETQRAELLDREARYDRLVPLVRGLIATAAGARPSGDAAQAMREEHWWNYLGNAQWYGGDARAALASYRRALAALSDPRLARDARIIVRIGASEFQIASTLAGLGRTREALAEIDRGVSAIARLRRFDDTPAVRHMWNIVRIEQAGERATIGRFADAIAEGRASIADREALARLEPGSYDAQRAVPVGLFALADIYRTAGRAADACATLIAARARWAALARTHPLNRFDGGYEQDRIRDRLGRCAPFGKGMSIRAK